MKNKFLVAAVGLVAFAACNPDDGPKVSELTITPESQTVFVDESLPTLVLTAAPEGILEGKIVTWTSSDPSVITVDGGGVLAFAADDIEEASKVITITATVDDKTATCTITVRGKIARYEIIDLTAELDFYILDRNVGATSATDPGYYFQWGKNEPVTAQTIDGNWTASGEGFSDWTKAGNSPCPKGWEPINGTQKDQIAANTADIISDYEMCLDFGVESDYTKDQYDAAKALWNKFNFVAGGSIRAGQTGMVNEDGIYNSTAVYIWTGALVAGKGGAAFSIEYNLSPMISKNGSSVAYAQNLRCVKAK